MFMMRTQIKENLKSAALISTVAIVITGVAALFMLSDSKWCLMAQVVLAGIAAVLIAYLSNRFELDKMEEF